MEKKYTNAIKMKCGGEENDKQFIQSTSTSFTVEDTTKRVKFLFPELSHKDINQVLVRAEYNMEKAIELLKELKQEQNKTFGNKSLMPRIGKKVKKRNYLELNQQPQTKPENIKETKNNNINNTTNMPYGININNIKNTTKSKEESDVNNQTEQNAKTSSDNSDNNDIINTIINNIDDERKNVINKKIDELLIKFDKMKDISELRKLLIETGFPLEKEDPEKEKKKSVELQKKLDDKLKQNKKLKDTIVNIYRQYERVKDDIKKKEDLIEEKSNTLGNLIEVEAEQKIRKELYENELKDIENSTINNNYLNGPKEGC